LEFAVNGPAGSYQMTVENPSSGTQPVDSDPALIEVVEVPMPHYNSTPPPGATIDFGIVVENPGNVQEVLNIENDGLPTGGPFDATCTIPNNPGGVYSLVSPADGMFTLDTGENADLTIACDTTLAGDYTGGTLSCDHDAPNSPDPATYTLDCVVTGDPVYGSSPAPGDPIDFGSFPQNNPAPNENLLINNDAGETGSILAGECSLTGGATPISVVGGPSVPYSVVMGAADAVIALACDTTQLIGVYNDTLVCTNNDPLFDGDAMYPVSCEILPPDPAVYASSPYTAGNPGDLIDLNEGNDPPYVGQPSLTTVLNIMNAAQPGDDFLDLLGCTYSGSAQISASPPNVTDDLDPGQSVNVTFTCLTDTAGTFLGTYTCPFDDNPSNIPPPTGPDGGVTSPATYPVECEVREQFSDVEESPPSGTPQTAELSPGDSITFDFNFEEVLDEGLDGSLESCALVSNTDFSIITSTTYPQTVPSGGPPVLVQVEFNDPGQGDTFTDTLNCVVEDNPDGGEPEQTQVSWPLEVNVSGRNARFRVTKDFDDDNPLGVEVFLDCNTGLPLQQSAEIHDPDAADLGPGDFTHVDFVIADFEPGTMDCDVFETVPAGYAASYFADIGDEGTANNVFADEDGCHYEGVEGADFVCEITNELQPVDVIVNKEWIDDNPEFQGSTTVEITLECTDPIIGGFSCGLVSGIEGAVGGNCAQRFIDPANPGEFEVLPHFDGTSCTATETPEIGVLIDESDCVDLLIFPGQGAECTIVNTRLFAGIPTLSQYGLLIMALLMLGVGLIGFRRYA